MKGLLGAIVYGLGTVGGSYALLGKHLPRPRASSLPRGFAQAFNSCSQCGAIRAHIVHSTTCRTCQTCGHITGDTQ